MIIEFVGAPCCGKSTISHEFAEMLRRDGLKVCEKPYNHSHNDSRCKRIFLKIMYALKYLYLHPYKSLMCLRVGRSVGWWINYLYISACTEGGGNHVLEQGLCQCTASLFNRKSVSAEKVDLYLSAIMPKDNDRFYVFVIASNDDICKRSEVRNDKPYYFNTEDMQNAIEKSIILNDLLMEKINTKFGEDCSFSVANNKENSVKEATSAIYTAIKLKKYI